MYMILGCVNCGTGFSGLKESSTLTRDEHTSCIPNGFHENYTPISISIARD